MRHYKDEPLVVRVYTVCDESKYLIVRNVPALGCGDELLKLFSTYGEVEECKPMDAEDCEPYTDVYWIKFFKVDNARFAKRKLDEFVFLGNRLQVSYAPHFESLSDTKEKLEGRRREVLSRLNPTRVTKRGSGMHGQGSVDDQPLELRQGEIRHSHNAATSGDLISQTVVSSEYFSSESMNQTVLLVRERLNKVQQSSVNNSEAGPPKKARVDNRRRI